MLRACSVFNAAQVDNLPPLPPKIPNEPLELLHNVERFIEATEAKVEHGGNRAC